MSGDAELRVLVLTPDYPPARGGIQLLIGCLAERLPDAEVRVGTLGRSGEEGVVEPLVAFRLGSRPSRWHKLNVVWLNARGLMTIARWRPDVVISGHIIAAPAGLVAQRFLGIPLVQYVYADEFRTRSELAKTVVRRAARVIAISDYTAELALSAGVPPERLHRIRPGIAPPRAVRCRRDETPTILTIARLVADYKGHDRIVAALPGIREEIPDVCWIVIGDGPRRPEIEQMVRSAGLESCVDFLGSVSDAERDGWLDRAHVFAMPSRLPKGGIGGDGFGLVFLEASSHGLAVVAGNVGGAVDAVVDGETGVLVDPTDTGEIGTAIIGLLGDPSRRDAMGRAGRRHAEEMSWERHANAVREVLETTVGGGPA